jgi:hypothetical protein
MGLFLKKMMVRGGRRVVGTAVLLADAAAASAFLSPPGCSAATQSCASASVSVYIGLTLATLTTPRPSFTVRHSRLLQAADDSSTCSSGLPTYDHQAAPFLDPSPNITFHEFKDMLADSRAAHILLLCTGVPG